MASNNWNSRNTYKTNANPKINMPMSENVGQRRLTFLWNISILYIIIIFIFFFVENDNNAKHRNIPEKI